jgi:hypothetical protein
MSVLSVLTTAGVTADRLFDGDGANNLPWVGDIAELVIYEQPLTSFQRKAVEDYLVLKYAPFVGTAGAPEFTPNGATFEDSVEVSLTSPTPGAEIRYTTDGSEPTDTSPLHESPLVFTATTLLQARAFRAGMNPSPVSVAHFTRAEELSPAAVPGLMLWARADVGLTSDEGGHVSVWRDVSGRSNDLRQTVATAQPSLVPDAHAGLPVVRFDGSDDTLLFKSRMTNIRSVFWVVKADAAASDGYRFLLGDASTTHFHSGAARQIWSTGASTAVLNGETRLNGVTIDGRTTNRPTSLSVISLLTTGDVTADAFSRDRTLGRSWWGDLAELLVYERALSSGERKNVEDYLALKYALYVPTVSAPVFTPNGGAFGDDVTVSLASTTPGAEIRYTTDGSEPTESSPLYGDPLVLTATTTVQARAFRAGMNPSPVSAVVFVQSSGFSPASVPGLVLWTRADLGVTADEAGRVSLWEDVSGQGSDLTQLTAGAQPTLVPDAAAGQPVVRFDGSDDTLLFTRRLTTIRTVFWVASEEPSAPNGYRYLLGDASAYDFASGNLRQIWSTSAAAAVLNGETRVNGARVDGKTANRPTSLSVISLVTTGNVTADSFSRDRTYGRHWWGDLAELVVYDRALTDSERKSVEDHLALRYGLYVPTLPAPVLAPNGSTASVPVRLTLSATSGAEIRYTTDGSEPSETSELYAEPLDLATRTTVKARAFLSGWSPSPVTTAIFLDDETEAPLRVAGLKLWVKADTGVTEAGGLVSGWLDQSGNANDLVQAVPASQPQIVAGAANGLPAVRFDGAGDFLSFSTRLTAIRTVFWVASADVSSHTGYRFLLGDASTYHFHSGATSTIWHASSSSAAIRSGETRVNGALVNGVTTERPTNLSLISLVTTGDVTADALSRDRANDRSWWGDVAELIVYERALTEAERQAVEGYLATKYALYVPRLVPPTISPAGGRVTGAQLVHLDTRTPGATIRYTLDDTEATENSPEYTGPFEVTGTRRVRARAFLAGWDPSPETVVTFFGEAEFSPASLSGLSLWVRADAGLEGGGTGLWADQGPALNSLVQAAPTLSPTVAIDETSRMPLLRFDGVDDTLLFSRRLTGIRTVVWVIRRSAAMAPGFRFLLGDVSNFDFCSNENMKLWSASYTNPAILNGQTRLDGAPVNGLTTDRPLDLSVISLVTTGGVTADAFSRDRTIPNRSWWGDLAELVIYERALSPAELRSLEVYLAGRYGIELAP